MDRNQYIFLLRLQEEMQEFSQRLVLSVSQIFTSVVAEPPAFKVVGLLDHVVLDLNLPGDNVTRCHGNNVGCCHVKRCEDEEKCCHGDDINTGCSVRCASPTGTARTSLSHISDSSVG